MNKLFKGLVLTALVAGSVNAATNKTFLMPRSHGVNLPMEYTGFNELIQHKNGDFFGAHFQVTPFYMESTNDTDLGKYFGIANKNLINLGAAAALLAGTVDFNHYYMIHDTVDATAATATSAGTVKYEPEMQAYGARIDYYQDLEKILDGLYLKVALPIVHVDNDMHITTAVSTAGTTLTAANLANYFKGDYSVDLTDANAQAALDHAMINGSQSETSVADLDVVLGYKLFEKDNYYVALNLGLTIPVGNDADGKYVFEPIVGNGDHWGFGGGLDASVKLWEDADQNIKLTGVANYRYLFSGTEKRTLGLVDTAGTQVPWGQYYLAGTIGSIRTAIQLTPVANILTQDVKVEVGSQLDAMLYFTYNNGGWNIDLGYNFFWKESENVSLKNAWTDDTYGIAHSEQTMLATDGDETFIYSAAAANATTNGGALAYINNAYSATGHAYGIDTSVAETPSQDTHKIFGSLGYIFREWEYPMLLSIGGGYEFADDDSIENWQIFGKLGIKF